MGGRCGPWGGGPRSGTHHADRRKLLGRPLRFLGCRFVAHAACWPFYLRAFVAECRIQDQGDVLVEAGYRLVSTGDCTRCRASLSLIWVWPRDGAIQSCAKAKSARRIGVTDQKSESGEPGAFCESPNVHGGGEKSNGLAPGSRHPADVVASSGRVLSFFAFSRVRLPERKAPAEMPRDKSRSQVVERIGGCDITSCGGDTKLCPACVLLLPLPRSSDLGWTAGDTTLFCCPGTRAVSGVEDGAAATAAAASAKSQRDAQELRCSSGLGVEVTLEHLVAEEGS
ncbi:hypothetical protein QBC47DRAFT_21309 [Echria macrotheca]|uniref:Uncharacterized protein n=1 Tax=Echria macrotheca TaxID=438768 RepID=A0AAJ0BQ49_9PEZI|nr:hypothetical protein QBC47DRAFT_21309 [Echria macrotheca]